MDYQELIEKLEIEEIIEIMEELGARTYRITQATVNFQTICHGGDSDSLVYYNNTKLFICYVNRKKCCNELGNNHHIVSMVQKIKEIEFADAIRWILNFLDGKDIETRKVVKKERYDPEEKKILPIYNKEDLKRYEQNFWWEEWAKEGIAYDTIVKYQIGSFGARQSIVIPVFDIEDNLVGIRQRHTQDYYINFGKYVPIEGYEFPSSATLYGINISKDNIMESHKAIIFEGEKSVMKYDSLYDYNISVAVFGSGISMQQIDILKSLQVETVVLAFDKDYQDVDSPEANSYRQKLDKLVDKLRGHFDVELIWDTENLLGYKDSPIDKGKEIFDRLLENSKMTKMIGLLDKGEEENKESLLDQSKWSFLNDKDKEVIEYLKYNFKIGEKFKAKWLWDRFNAKSMNSRNSILKSANIAFEIKKVGQSLILVREKDIYTKKAHGNIANDYKLGKYNPLGATNIMAHKVLNLVDDGLLEDRWISKGALLGLLIDKNYYNGNVISSARKWLDKGTNRNIKNKNISIKDYRYMAKVGKVKSEGKIDTENMKSREVSRNTYDVYVKVRKEIFDNYYQIADEEKKDRKFHKGKFFNLYDLLCNGSDEMITGFNQRIAKTISYMLKNGDFFDYNINVETETIGVVWEEFQIEDIEDEDSVPLKNIDLREGQIDSILRMNFLISDSFGEEKVIFKNILNDVVEYKEEGILAFGSKLNSIDNSFEGKLNRLRNVSNMLYSALKNDKCKRDDINEVVEDLDNKKDIG